MKSDHIKELDKEINKALRYLIIEPSYMSVDQIREAFKNSMGYNVITWNIQIPENRPKK